MSLVQLTRETLAKPAEDDDEDHISCHCSDNAVSFCGLDVSDVPMAENFWDDEDMCALCVLAMYAVAPKCPWGCACPEECGEF